jgi:hypothetical protein
MIFKFAGKLLSVASIALLFASCSKNDEAGVKFKNYSDANGTYVNLSTQSQWSVVKTNSGGTIHYNFIGTTNADRVTITPNNTATTTVEDAQAVTLGTDKSFSQDFTISSFTGSPSGQVNQNLIINAYRGNDILTVNVNSGQLNY